MDYKKYWNNGMGLHETQLKLLHEVIDQNDIKNIVEFGSGKSTEFFLDLKRKFKYKFTLCTFDHSDIYSYKKRIVDYFLPKNSFFIKIRKLIFCGDDVFKELFKNKYFDKKLFKVVEDEDLNNFQLRNSFYDIKDEDLPESIDLLVVDGPNGNGRSLAFLVAAKRLKVGGYIMNDDANHYDFYQRCSEIFKTILLEQNHDKKIHHNFSYMLLKVCGRN